MTDYAIVQTGGKQYRCDPGATVRVESLRGDVGDELELDDVLMLSQDGNVTLGNPTVSGAKVTTEILGHGRGKKIVVFKYKATAPVRS